MQQRKIELLSPAKDPECGIAAINYGADAVYIGAPKFGARKAASNSIGDIEALINYAHKYFAKVYVALNTIIYNSEIIEAGELVHQLYNIGTDALIIQDMALLEMDLPPIPLFASTQTHNYDIERIKFLESCGIQRVILAREMPSKNIKALSEKTSVELEAFVHGALCVSFSGQCYFSYATTGRSANRGECSQPCRLPYSLLDAEDKIIIKDKYLLSLKDLNLSAHLSDLLDAGITSFKIEGRLKDINYVKNITAYYRQKLDAILNHSNTYKKSSSGRVKFTFTPDPAKSFNRGFTEYFYSGKADDISSFNTPKSLGEYIGKAEIVRRDFFEIETEKKLVNGDGICFADLTGNLAGMNISKIEKNKIFIEGNLQLTPGTPVFRNYDHNFNKELMNDKSLRKINVFFTIKSKNEQINIHAEDEDGIYIDYAENYKNKDGVTSERIIKAQFFKSGNTIFEVTEVNVVGEINNYFSSAELNSLRRRCLELLESERVIRYQKGESLKEKSSAKYPFAKINYMGNVVNDPARKFYRDHGVESIEDGFELQNDFSGKVIMTTKHCIKRELKMCSLEKGVPEFKEPLYLKDFKRKYILSFDCGNCLMKIIHL